MEQNDQLADIISLDWSNNVFHELEGFDVQVGLNGSHRRGVEKKAIEET